MGSQESTGIGSAVAYNPNTGDVVDSRPKNFVVQSTSDFKEMTEHIYKTKPCITKTIILPPGVEVDDPRLAEGTVVAERGYVLEPGQDVTWPTDGPFEADIAGSLLPKTNNTTHFAIYPDCRFKRNNCNLCTLHETAHPEPGRGEAIPQVSGGVAAQTVVDQYSDTAVAGKRRLSMETVSTYAPPM